MTLKLRLRDLYADNSSKPFANIFALKRICFVFNVAACLSVAIYYPSECRLKSGEVGSALKGVDVVSKRIDRLNIAVVILNRDFEPDAVFHVAEINRLGEERLLRFI